MIVTISWRGNNNNRQQRFDLMENALYKSNYYYKITVPLVYIITLELHKRLSLEIFSKCTRTTTCNKIEAN